MKLFIVCIALTCSIAVAWSQWNYTIQWYVKSQTPEAIAEEIANKKNVYYGVWSSQTLEGATKNAPRPRRGHSMVIARTPTDAPYPFNGPSYIIMFGGRDNQNITSHVPKTYNIQKVNGTIEFTTYEDKPVNPCSDTEGLFYTAAQRSNCEGVTDKIVIGKIYNDVWAYRICNETAGERVFDGACINNGWQLLHAGGAEGGCSIELGILVCTVPSERYNHGAVMYNDQTMYVYGGFSQRCVDFCDDIWFYDIYVGGWRQVYEAGQLSRLYFEKVDILEVYYDSYDVPNNTDGWAGPGKRWRHSMVAGDEYFDNATQLSYQKMAIFGGHRLWHGYAQENSQTNSWDSYSELPPGGYLDDLWIYTKELDRVTEPGATLKQSQGRWQIQHANVTCRPNPGRTWDERNDQICERLWPQARAGHGSVFDTKRNWIWIFGGYNTYFPYLSTDGVGAGPGVSSVIGGGFVPYPAFNYYMNDLWYYDLTHHNWTQIIYPTETVNERITKYNRGETLSTRSVAPDARADHIMLLAGPDVIFVHGGFADNTYYDDTWYFYIETGKWLEKTAFTYPLYPETCTDDWEDMNITFVVGNTTDVSDVSGCHLLLYPKHLERDTLYPFEELPYSKQRFYWPDSEYGPYNVPPYNDVDISAPAFPIMGKGFSEDPNSPRLDQFKNRSKYGDPLFPFAATGPMQYARPFVYQFNETYNATLLEKCTSVSAEPTRGRVLDGLWGRSDHPIFIDLPRRRRPGWNGCRDRVDGRTDMPQTLQYVKPLGRAMHKAVFFPDTSEVFMYGGMVNFNEVPKNLGISYPTLVRDDMWYFNLFHCINNCSLHGDCQYGFCICDVGYYGLDCSNTSCPGTFCTYDVDTHEQECTHACHAGYNHYDGEHYVQDIHKLPCSFAAGEDRGESNGICDGYGTSYCAPPFLGEDCSIKDCKHNCSFNGWCSIEYPVSRCMCNPGYFGDICQYKQCLNNCSTPNGWCNVTSGTCNCNMMNSPYYNKRVFKPWAGEDCSYIHPYESAPSTFVTWSVALIVGLATAYLMI